jgi:hypothetical protein
LEWYTVLAIYRDLQCKEIVIYDRYFAVILDVLHCDGMDDILSLVVEEDINVISLE